MGLNSNCENRCSVLFHSYIISNDIVVDLISILPHPTPRFVITDKKNKKQNKTNNQTTKQKTTTKKQTKPKKPKRLCFLTGAKFEFPTISDTFKATRNATVTVPFILNTEDCGDNLDRNFSIAVAKKKERSGGIFTDLCKILVDDSESCVPFREKVCTCENEKGRYSLTKTVDLSDETLWRWKTSNGNIASDRKIQFVVECKFVCMYGYVYGCVHVCVRELGRFFVYAMSFFQYLLLSWVICLLLCPWPLGLLSLKGRRCIFVTPTAIP